MKPILEIKNLHIYYQVKEEVSKAVNGVDLEIFEGETLGLVGETGAGKTTTALGIMDLIQTPPGKIIEGEIFFKGKNLVDLKESDMEKIRGGEISMIFQDPMTALNPVMTVGDQIKEVISLHRNCSNSEAVIKSKEMMELVGIESSRYGDYPHQFSGGMKQRIVIGMAIANEPVLLLADEPTTALDVTIQAQVLNLIQDLRKRIKSSMLLITHDLGVVAETCDKVAIMYAGHILEHGSLEDIFDRHVHPYTRGLFESIPNMEEEVERLKPIQGMMPDPANLPEGCVFADRCRSAVDKCRTGAIPVVEYGKGHFVRCIRVKEMEAQNE